jgi:hypothetical protein
MRFAFGDVRDPYRFTQKRSRAFVAKLQSVAAVEKSKNQLRDTRHSEPHAPSGVSRRGFATPFRSHPTLKFSAEVFPLLGTSS